MVVGLGVQGRKRCEVAGGDVVATVDPVVAEASHRTLESVPSNTYDAVVLCVPDAAKLQLIHQALDGHKHILVEKPLLSDSDFGLGALESEARQRALIIYTAYNHRFEPHVAKVRDLLKQGAVGNPYRCSLFYGNGTARLVRQSPWRDKGAGVVSDLGSHNIDIACEWFGEVSSNYQASLVARYENESPDHCVFHSVDAVPHIQIELSLISWRNSFRAEIVGSEGSLHIEGLAKWGESTLILRERVLPSGRPKETIWRVPQGDPTWRLEYAHFLNLCRSGVSTDLRRDRFIQDALRRVASSAVIDARVTRGTE